MVKFSVTGKKRSSDTLIKHRCYSDDDVEEDDELVYLQSKKQEVEAGESSSSSIGKQKDIGGGDLITVMLDPDVLDCSICFEPLVPPVFQVMAKNFSNTIIDFILESKLIVSPILNFYNS